MSRTRAYNQNTREIIQRYFVAVDECKKNHRIKSARDFCLNNGITPSSFYFQKANTNRGYFEVGWLVPLIRDCGISSTWLLFGVGSMFNY